MDRILVVEDSETVGGILVSKLQETYDFEVAWAKNYADTEALFADGPHGFFIALCDLNLPDCKPGAAVDFALGKSIPTVVFTGEYSDDLRESFWDKGVVDYVMKEGPQNFEYIVSLVGRIHRNRVTKVLVVDDSQTSRTVVRGLLESHCYQVFEAENGQQALNCIDKHPGIRMVISDYSMPGIQGDELTRRIRKNHSLGDLAIIGISAEGSSATTARFLKNGANDFLAKPFVNEEFYCRVNQNMAFIEHVEQIRHLANHDYLTGLANRAFFYEAGRTLFAAAKRKNTSIRCAMIDIDHFKRVNDTYGHEAGDHVIREIAGILRNRFRESDIVARIGGEEFCVLVTDVQREHALSLFTALRKLIAKKVIDVNGREVSVTVSIGVCLDPADSIEQMVKAADEMLYAAKNKGRNRVEPQS